MSDRAIATLPPHTLSAACVLVGRAFAADPFARHAIPDAQGREERLAHLYRPLMAATLRYGHVEVTSKSFTGLAGWLPPGNEIVGTIQQIRCGGLGVPFRVPWGILRRYLDYGSYANALHRKLVSEPHWYLAVLAVGPEHQGQEQGSELLRAGLLRVDAESRPCYLETQNPRNIALYERHGFEVVEQTRVPSTPIDHWCMLRPAS